MSTPENPLAKYRSYSYHHVLIACDNEAAARFIRESDRPGIFRDLEQQRAVTITEDERIVPLENTDDVQVGSYVVIINGMVDTAFVIRDVEWFTTTAASTDQHDKFTSIAVEGKMTVEEPRGIRFMNALNGACDKLQSDPTGVIWMLKTIFVGHGVTDLGDEFSDYITNLRPLEFMIYDVTGVFDVTGGVYEIAFAGANNGAARFPQFSRVAETITVNPKGDKKLSTSMNILAKNMQDRSIKNRQCVIDALKRTYSDIDPTKLDGFRQVNYAIILEDPYTNSEYEIDGWTEQELDNTTGTGVFKFGPKSTIEQAIRHIMDRCSRVKKDLTEGTEDGIRYSWKVHSEITMVGKGTRNPIGNKASDVDVIQVVYRIRRHMEANNQTIERVLNLQSDGNVDDEVTQQTIRENLIEFDYFFSGKNTDILNLDIKMEMGLAFLQTISSSNNLGTGVNQIKGVYSENATIVVPTENDKENPNVSSDSRPRQKILIRSKTPIFPATNTSNVQPTQNIRGAHDTTLFSAMLSRHAALESLEVLLTIHGNPYMMSQTNRRGSDRQRSGNEEAVDGTTIFKNWDFVPALGKINIFMPSSNDTPSSTDRFDRERFWYDGYYYIFGIDHKFQGGQFTQDLHLMALPSESLLVERNQTDISECGISEEEGSTGDSGSSEAQEAPTATEATKANARNRPAFLGQ